MASYRPDYPGARNNQKTFDVWLGEREHTGKITIPGRGTEVSEVVVTDAGRWDQINTLLHGETVTLYAQISGLFTLLLAQLLETIVAMRTGQITLKDDARVFVAFETLRSRCRPDWTT